MSEKVSVLFVLPVGSTEDAAVQETLRGISSQTYPSSLIEVIRVQYVPAEPGARTSALNAAREGASGAFVVHAEPGVVWDGNKLEQQVRRLKASPSAGACVHRMTARNSDGKTWALDLGGIRAYGPRIGCLLRSPWGPGAAMLQQEVMARVGVYRNAEEVLWEYAIRLVEKGHVLDLLDEDLAVWNTDAPVEEQRPLVPAQIRYGFLKSHLDRTSPEALFSSKCPESTGRLILAGLYQKNDDLEASHTLCQEAGGQADGPEASYWHGIVHRREPDFSNARGWFKKAEGLSALPEISREVVAFLQRVLQVPDYGEAREVALRFLHHLQSHGTWDPFYFVDLCEACMRGGTTQERQLLEKTQEIEFDRMFDWTYRMATE